MEVKENSACDYSGKIAIAKGTSNLTISLSMVNILALSFWFTRDEK